MTVQETQRPRTIGISISDSPDIRALGLSAGHLRDAMTDVATHLLSSGDDWQMEDLREAALRKCVYWPPVTPRHRACSFPIVTRTRMWLIN